MSGRPRIHPLPSSSSSASSLPSNHPPHPPHPSHNAMQYDTSTHTSNTELERYRHDKRNVLVTAFALYDNTLQDEILHPTVYPPYPQLSAQNMMTDTLSNVYTTNAPSGLQLVHATVPQWPNVLIGQGAGSMTDHLLLDRVDDNTTIINPSAVPLHNIMHNIYESNNMIDPVSYYNPNGDDDVYTPPPSSSSSSPATTACTYLYGIHHPESCHNLYRSLYYINQQSLNGVPDLILHKAAIQAIHHSHSNNNTILSQNQHNISTVTPSSVSSSSTQSPLPQQSSSPASSSTPAPVQGGPMLTTGRYFHNALISSFLLRPRPVKSALSSPFLNDQAFNDYITEFSTNKQCTITRDVYPLMYTVLTHLTTHLLYTILQLAQCRSSLLLKHIAKHIQNRQNKQQLPPDSSSSSQQQQQQHLLRIYLASKDTPVKRHENDTMSYNSLNNIISQHPGYIDLTGSQRSTQQAPQRPTKLPNDQSHLGHAANGTSPFYYQSNNSSSNSSMDLQHIIPHHYTQTPHDYINQDVLLHRPEYNDTLIVDYEHIDSILCNNHNDNNTTATLYDHSGGFKRASYHQQQHGQSYNYQQDSTTSGNSSGYTLDISSYDIFDLLAHPYWSKNVSLCTVIANYQAIWNDQGQ